MSRPRRIPRGTEDDERQDAGPGRGQPAPATGRPRGSAASTAPTRELGRPSLEGALIGLQRTAGNRAVAGLLAGHEPSSTGEQSPSAGVIQRQQMSTVQRDYDSEDFKAGYRAGKNRVEANPGTRTGEAAVDFNEGYEKGKFEADKADAQAAQEQKVKDLDRNFEGWLLEGNFELAAESLNEFSPDDIRVRLQRHAASVAELHAGALANPRLGPGSNAATLTLPAVPESGGAAKGDTSTAGGGSTAQAGTSAKAPEAIPYGPPTSQPYDTGVGDAENYLPPRHGLPWDQRTDYAAGYESVLRKIEVEMQSEQGAGEAGAEGEEKGPLGGAKAGAKSFGAGVLDEQAPKLAKRYLKGHIPEVPYFGLVEMATELQGDTPMFNGPTPEWLAAQREALREAMAEHIASPAEDEEPDASVPDATTR